jgi:Transposase
MKALASLIGSFAALLVPDPANEGKLVRWIAQARAADLPDLHSFARGLDLDMKAATAALTLPYHNGRTEGVNTKTKMLKRQMFGRAGFELLRHRILLGLGHGSSPPKERQSRELDKLPASRRRSRPCCLPACAPGS